MNIDEIKKRIKTNHESYILLISPSIYSPSWQWWTGVERTLWGAPWQTPENLRAPQILKGLLAYWKVPLAENVYKCMSSRCDYKTVSLCHCSSSATTPQAWMLHIHFQPYKDSVMAANLTRAQNKMEINLFPWGRRQKASRPHVIIFRLFENSTEIYTDCPSPSETLESIKDSDDKIRRRTQENEKWLVSLTNNANGCFHWEVPSTCSLQ